MFPRVLVATDFSPHADQTLECIGEIPGMEEILLVHVIDEARKNEKPVFSLSPHRSVLETATATLEEKKKYLEGLTGVSVFPRMVESVDGDTAGAVIQLAQRENISLIVMGGRGHGLLYGYILGSVSEAVVHRSRTDLLIMHFRGSDKPDQKKLEKFCRSIFYHVLCPVDFSRPSLKSVEYAAGLAGVRQMTLLHVLDGEASGNDLPLLTENTHRQLDQIGADPGAKGIRVSSLVRSGNPAQVIASIAEELDVSLIMIARVGQSDYAKNIPLGSVAAGVLATAERPLFIVNPHISLNVRPRELAPQEFALAEDLWLDYHQQKADPATDRIFGVFVENTLAAVARCRHHPDGYEVDAVYVPDDFRERGYARRAVQALVDACGSEPLFMHATLDLVRFYNTFGFIPIDEHDLPRSIMERFSFAEGDLEGTNVQPMRRTPTVNSVKRSS